MKKKVFTATAGLVLLLGGTSVGFAAGMGFFDNSKLVETNIIKLADIAGTEKQRANELQKQLNQNGNEQSNLKNQIKNLEEQLKNKQKEVENKQQEIENKQKEVDAKQKEVDQKQKELDAAKQELDLKKQENDQLRQQLDALIAANNDKDAEIKRLLDLSNQKINELTN